MKKLTLAQVRAAARKEGSVTVSLFPSKCGPSNTTWVKGMEITVHYIENEFLIARGDGDETLQSVINEFSYYNCNSELGYRVHYYINE